MDVPDLLTEISIMNTIIDGRYNIDHIHERLGDLSDFIGTRWGVIIGSRSGADTAIECPQHRPGHTTSATVHRWPDGRQTFKCWRCDIGPADAIDLLVMMGDSHNRGDAIRLLADLLNITKSSQPATARPVQRKRTATRLEPMAETTDQEDLSDAGLARVREYCEWRQWPKQTIEHYRLRSVRRFDGWRIRHPFLDGEGVQLAAQDYSANGDPRWISAKGSNLGIFGQQNIKYLDRLEPIIDITEGLSDCITVSAARGFNHAVVGTPGASSWRLQYSEAFSRCRLILWPDNDDAGERFAENIKRIHSSTAALSWPVKRGRIPEQYKDLSEWYQSNPRDFAGDFGSARFDAWKAAS